MEATSTNRVPRVSSLSELLRARATEEPGRRAYTYLKDQSANVAITYGELDRGARAVAARLSGNLNRGERALLLYPPGIDFLTGFFGCLYAGVIAVPLPLPGARGGLEKLALVRGDTEAKAALTVSDLAEGKLGGAGIGDLLVLATDRIEENPADSFPEPAEPVNPAYLQYTSGSTSAPRGVMVTHANVLHNLANIDDGFEHTPESVTLTWLPHFHDMGLIYGLLAPLYHGIPCYMMSPAAFVQRPLSWLEAITRFRATHSGGPNFAYDLCVRRIQPEERVSLDLSSWKVAFNGAEPVHAETLERFSKAFAPCGFRFNAFHPAYGLAEASLKVTGGSAASEPVVFPASASALARNRVEPASENLNDTRVLVGCGRAGRDTRVVIVNPETLQPCQPDEVGEIWVSGPGVATGYWRRPRETEQTFGARLAETGEGPFLRTGDLGFLRDGELFVAGRLKDVIIIRGLNHHPSDIELTARHAHPAVATSIAAAFSVEMEGEERLVLVMEAGRREPKDPEEIARSVRQAVAERHEVRIWGFVLVQKGGIPKTSSGKVQRRLCRSLYLDEKLPMIFESVLGEETEEEEAGTGISRDLLLAAGEGERLHLVTGYVRDQLARVLKLQPQELAIDTPATSYGIDSLMAMEVQNRIETDLGVSLAAVELLEGTTIEQFARSILNHLSARPAAPAPIPRRNAAEAPLSFEQERLWMLNRMTPGSAAYHIPFAFRLKGPLDVAAIEESLNRILERQESLRTVFRSAGGSVVSVVTPPERVVVKVTDLRRVAKADREDEALALAAREVRKPFDLEKGPLFRFKIYRLGSSEHIALVVMHHIISDFWSVRLFIEELLEGYQAGLRGEAPPLEPPRVQYGDFAAWQREQLRGEKLRELLEFWQQQLTGAQLLEFATDRPRPAKPTLEAATEIVAFPSGLSHAVREFARREGVTPFTVLLAAFEMLAARCSNQTDLLIGTTNANRGRSELEPLIGFFAAPLPVRTQLTGDPGFREILRRAQRALLDAYAHQELPFAKMVEAARNGGQTGNAPLFRIMFSVLNPLLPVSETADLELESLELGTTATDFDLFLNIVEEDSAFRALAVYSKDLYNAETIRHLMAVYVELLRTAIEEPETRITALKIPEELTPCKPKPAPEEDTPLIAVAATFTAEPVKEIVSFWLRELEFDHRIRFAPYNQVFQQLLDPASMLGRNRDGVNVILLRLEDWARGANPTEGNGLEENVRQFLAAIRSAASRAQAPFLIYLCPASPEFAAGQEEDTIEKRMQELIVSSLAGISGVYVADSAELRELYPVTDYYDPHGDRLGHVPYTPEFFAALGTLVARKMHALLTTPAKLIVLDCDQTLWSGVCGEDGPEGVRLDPPRRALQEFMLAQRNAGMLLAIASKNNEEDVWAAFDAHPEMPLGKAHFVAWRIDWNAKSENLKSLAAELGIGLDTVIFVDDNPAECAEVEARLPEVVTLALPSDAGRIPEFLKHVWAFDHLRTTEEDQRRSEMYNQRLERRRVEKQVVTLAEFLAALDLKIDIGPMKPEELPRVSQLTLRTNQMNLTAVRRSESQVREYLSERGGECLTVHVTDRFGDYGLVGVVLFTTTTETLDVDTFLLSCRALGRGVEHAMLARLGDLALDRGLKTVNLRYVRTPRSQPALLFLRGVAKEFETPAGNGYRYSLPAEKAAAVTYDPESRPGEPEDVRPAPRESTAAVHRIDYARIATELAGARAILNKVRAEMHSEAASTIPYEEPRTPLEKQLAAIWAEMLHVPRVGINDNFFDLGGHSLLAVQLLSRVRETFDVDLPLDVVFTGVFSVAELAKAIEMYEIERAGSEEYAALLDELEGLSDEEVRALLEQEGGNQETNGS